MLNKIKKNVLTMNKNIRDVNTEITFKKKSKMEILELNNGIPEV